MSGLTEVRFKLNRCSYGIAAVILYYTQSHLELEDLQKPAALIIIHF